jgi:hypothetical protein
MIPAKEPEGSSLRDSRRTLPCTRFAGRLLRVCGSDWEQDANGGEHDERMEDFHSAPL